MKYKSIVISGKIATGTTTAGERVAERLNLPFRSAGEFFRKYIIDNKIPLYGNDQIPDEVDIQMDKELQKDAKEGSVLDSHYAGYFNRNNGGVLKILLKCDDKVRIQRAIDRVHTHKETEEDIKKREIALDKKFRKLYSDEDYLNPKFFDLVIDNTKLPKEETVDRIVKAFGESED